MPAKSLIDRMVDRFLGWKLPANFGPDAGTSFKPYHQNQTPDSHLWPVGTNLFTADQAKAMFEHALGDKPYTELSLRELDAIGQGYFNGPLNSNEEMFGRAVERVVVRRLFGTDGVKGPEHG